jgi:hypothetical protein
MSEKAKKPRIKNQKKKININDNPVLVYREANSDTEKKDQLCTLTARIPFRYINQPQKISNRANIDRYQDPCKTINATTESLEKKKNNGGSPANEIKAKTNIKCAAA